MTSSVPASSFLPWLPLVTECDLRVVGRNKPVSLQVAFGFFFCHCARNFKTEIGTGSKVLPWQFWFDHVFERIVEGLWYFWARKVIACLELNKLLWKQRGDNTESSKDDLGLICEISKRSFRDPCRLYWGCSIFWSKNLWCSSAGLEELSVRNKRLEPLQLNLLF